MDSDTKRLFSFILAALLGVVSAGIFTLTAPAADESAPPALDRADIKVGDQAPAFSLPMYPQGTFHLGDEGNQTLVLYFYPGDGTPQCTKQALAFRDHLADFQQAGAVIYGVSPDSLDSHAAFTKQYNLPYPLLVDADGRVRMLYGMPDSKAEIQGRMTYVIDKTGTVRAVVGELQDMDRHVSQVLAAVQQVASSSPQTAQVK